MLTVNDLRIDTFDVAVASGNGYLYLTVSDDNTILTTSGEIRFRLVQALDTYQALHTSYTDLDLVTSGGVFDFEDKTLKFTGLSGTTENVNGTGNGNTITTEREGLENLAS